VLAALIAGARGRENRQPLAADFGVFEDCAVPALQHFERQRQRLGQRLTDHRRCLGRRDKAKIQGGEKRQHAHRNNRQQGQAALALRSAHAGRHWNGKLVDGLARLSGCTHFFCHANRP
jgi:hypothetical protein